MRLLYLSCALAAATTFGGAASAANICQADKLTCPTTMPVGGFCECTAHGDTKDGTVVAKKAPHPPVNAAGAGCATHAGTPGCP